MATFDSTIHFYSMRPGRGAPLMLVVPDIADVYCPLSGNVVVNLQQSRELVRWPLQQPCGETEEGGGERARRHPSRGVGAGGL